MTELGSSEGGLSLCGPFPPLMVPELDGDGGDPGGDLSAYGAELVRSSQAWYKFPASTGTLLIYSREDDCQDTPRPLLALNSVCNRG